MTRYLAVGLGVGGQLQRFGRNGLSIAPTLRLGSLDGLNFSLEYAYSVAANQYTGQRTDRLLQRPRHARRPARRAGSRSSSTAGLSLQVLGLRAPSACATACAATAGPGTWFVTGAFGGAWVTDRAPCNYDAAVPCGASARSFGPTISVGLERRF